MCPVLMAQVIQHHLIPQLGTLRAEISAGLPYGLHARFFTMRQLSATERQPTASSCGPPALHRRRCQVPKTMRAKDERGWDVLPGLASVSSLPTVCGLSARRLGMLICRVERAALGRGDCGTVDKLTVSWVVPCRRSSLLPPAGPARLASGSHVNRPSGNCWLSWPRTCLRAPAFWNWVPARGWGDCLRTAAPGRRHGHQHRERPPDGGPGCPRCLAAVR